MQRNTWLEHLTASATPADGICVGNVIVAWSQLDIGGRRLVLPERYLYQPVVGPQCAKIRPSVVWIAPTEPAPGTVYLRLIAIAITATYHASLLQATHISCSASTCCKAAVLLPAAR
jgi:hypothetical protein